MATDLSDHVQSVKLVDTHEHLRKESEWLDDGPDILQDLFGNYVPADLHTAGASDQAMKNLMDSSNPDIIDRFDGIREAWEATQFTGYGEAVRIIASEIYGIDEITGKSLAAAQDKNKDLQQPGERYRLLHDVANLDHVQTDDFCWQCYPDDSGPEFFLYDLSWAGFCNGQVDPQSIHKEVGIEVTNWVERSDEDAGKALDHILKEPEEKINMEMRLCLGDWAWAQGVALSIEHNLPFKIHTGYYAGSDRMPVSRIPAGNMCSLLAKYLEAKFVLMHIAYPYSDELVAIAKHYSNVWVDMCWAWSIDPYSSRDFLRRFIHAVPINKIFTFGGDTGWPTSSVAYAFQARREIQKALEDEIADGYMSEKQAMTIATKIMYDNQYECFDLHNTRTNIHSLT